MAVTVVKARTRASNVEGLSTEISNAVGAEQSRAQSAEAAIALGLQNVVDAMQTNAEALTSYNALVELINSGDVADQEAIQALVDGAVKSKVERALDVAVGGKIVLNKKPVAGVDSIDRLIVTFNGEDFDLLADSVDSGDASGKTILLGGTDFDGGVVKFIKYDYRLQDN